MKKIKIKIKKNNKVWKIKKIKLTLLFFLIFLISSLLNFSWSSWFFSSDFFIFFIFLKFMKFLILLIFMIQGGPTLILTAVSFNLVGAQAWSPPTPAHRPWSSPSWWFSSWSSWAGFYKHALLPPTWANPHYHQECVGHDDHDQHYIDPYICWYILYIFI